MLKFLVENWYLLLTALVSGGLLLWPQLRGGTGAGRIGAAEAVRLINREKAVLIDVSEPEEYARGHAGGARNVPLGRLDGAKELPSNKALPLVLVCATGARATRAAAQLRKAGHEHTHVLAGGLSAWREAQLPVEKSSA